MPPIEPQPRKDTGKLETILTLLPELNTSLISKSQAEYLYTGSSIAGFGAVSWGVGALRNGIAPVYFHPAIIACVGILIVAVAVIFKIVHDHNLYVENQKIIVKLRNTLLDELGHPEWFPSELLVEEKATRFPSGYFVSVLVLIAGAVSSILFCLSMYFYAPAP